VISVQWAPPLRCCTGLLTDHQGFTEGSYGKCAFFLTMAWYQWRFVDMQDVVCYLLDNVPRKATLHMQGRSALLQAQKWRRIGIIERSYRITAALLPHCALRYTHAKVRINVTAVTAQA